MSCSAKAPGVALALIVALAAGACAESEPRRTRNVILIVVDTLRADHLSCYGYQRPTSPNIDAFARGATRYRRSFATSPWTVPTHASLFTGKVPFAHGAHSFKVDRRGENNVNPLHEDQFTLAEMFSAEGIETAAFVANVTFLSRRWQLDQGFSIYEVEQGYAEAINKLAFPWLEQRTAEGFFLFLNYFDAHRPYNTLTPAPFLESPAVTDKGELLDKLRAEVLPGQGSLPAELAQQVIDQYDTAVANVDAGIGKLFDKLKALELYDDTLIVLTSDHGEHFGEHMLVEHAQDVYMEATAVPLIVKTPGQSAGATSDQIVSSIDIPGMILDRLDPEVAEPHRRHFPARPGEHPVIIENYYARDQDLWDRRWGHRFNRIRRAIVDWPYKFIHSSDRSHELYDLDADPAESDNRYLTERETVRRLSVMLAQYFKAHPKAEAIVPQAPLSPEEKKQLEALGYMAGEE